MKMYTISKYIKHTLHTFSNKQQYWQHYITHTLVTGVSASSFFYLNKKQKGKIHPRTGHDGPEGE
jgi:hypothetical protein